MEDSSLSASKETKFLTLPDSVCLEECQKQLRSIYKTRNKVKIIPWDQSSAVHMDEIYIDMSWVMDYRKPSGVMKLHHYMDMSWAMDDAMTPSGVIQKRLDQYTDMSWDITPSGVIQKKLVHYTEIFAPRGVHPAPKRILVYGQPGIGKTVFTQKTTFDWSQQKFPKTLGRFDLVFLVRLRDVCDLQDVKSILGASEVLASDAPISVDNLYDYVLRHQERVLLIMDGYDEYVYSTGYQSPIFEIWKKNQLRDCCVVMTSAGTGDDELSYFYDAQFLIHGFSDQRQEEFARRFLKDNENVKEFLKYLEQHNLRKMARIPLLLLMLCLLWMGKDHKALPQKRAHIFDQFVETLIDHIHEKQTGGSVFMKKDYTAELYALGHLAFEALLQDCPYFPISKLPMHELIESLIEVGLFQVLNVESSLRPEKGVFFIHKFVQEYLAANFLKEELVSKTTESKALLSQLDPIKTIRKLFEVSKFTCDLSDEAAREIMVQLGMAAKKKGLTEYSFDSETLTKWDLSYRQNDFIKLCKQLFFYCSAETRRNLFPTFLSSLGGVLLIDSDELNVVVNEELLKTTEAPKYIFFDEHDLLTKNNKYREKDYLNLITLTEQLNAVIVSCSGKMKASEFLSNFTWRSIDEFFLIKEKTTYLYVCRILKLGYNGINLPHKMMRELINYPESRKKTKINPAGESSEQACSTHALSRVWWIKAWDVNRSEVELLSDVLPFLLAPQEIEIIGKYGAKWDSDMAKKILSAISPSHRLKQLTLSRLNVQSSAAGFIARLIKQSRNLEHLDLSFNPLQGEGVDAICQHLGSTPHLWRLWLEGVKMTAEQVQHLSKEAMKHSSITRLYTDYHDLAGNLLPYRKWPSEEYWKRLYSQVIPDLKQQQILADTRPSVKDAFETGSVRISPVPPDPAVKHDLPHDELHPKGKGNGDLDKSKIYEGILTSEGINLEPKGGALYLIFPPDSVSAPTSIVIYKWKCRARSPPSQEHEAVVSDVIEIATNKREAEALKFKVAAQLFLCHSAPDLAGYEVVIKKLIDIENDIWEDVVITEDLQNESDVSDFSSLNEFEDVYLPVAQADISECSTYAVVCRLRSSPSYTVTSFGGSFNHPCYPGVTVTIPKNAVARKTTLSLRLKVQEVPRLEGQDLFYAPILRINCSPAVKFLKPVTIQLPVSFRGQQTGIPSTGSTCRVRVFFLKSNGERKECTEITRDLRSPASFDGTFVRFEVDHFCGYEYVSCKQGRGVKGKMSLLLMFLFDFFLLFTKVFVFIISSPNCC